MNRIAPAPEEGSVTQHPSRGKSAATDGARTTAAQLLETFNALGPREERKRSQILQKLIGTWNGAVVKAPFHVTNGGNLHFDEACFVNEGCAIDDTYPVRIGSFTQLARDVRILTVIEAENRRGPVTIGRNVWIGAGAAIHPGVTIGEDAIIGAAAVVISDVPPGATASGNPAKIMR